MNLHFENVSTTGLAILIHPQLYRAKVPHGWFVLSSGPERCGFFYPDPQHKWDGNSMAASVSEPMSEPESPPCAVSNLAGTPWEKDPSHTLSDPF